MCFVFYSWMPRKVRWLSWLRPAPKSANPTHRLPPNCPPWQMDLVTRTRSPDLWKWVTLEPTTSLASSPTPKHPTRRTRPAVWVEIKPVSGCLAPPASRSLQGQAVPAPAPPSPRCRQTASRGRRRTRRTPTAIKTTRRTTAAATGLTPMHCSSTRNTRPDPRPSRQTRYAWRPPPPPSSDRASLRPCPPTSPATRFSPYPTRACLTPEV